MIHQIYTDKMPDNCEQCQSCLLYSLDVFYTSRHENCPLITWQPGTTAPKDEIILLRRIGETKPFVGRFDGDMEFAHGFDWLPLPLAGA